MKTFLLSLLLSVSILGCASTPTNQEGEPEIIAEKAKDAVVVPMPSKALNLSAPLTRIAFGSCLSEEEDQSIWTALGAENADLFLFIGDNVYGDPRRNDPEFQDPTMPKMRRSYAKLATHQSFADFRAATPLLTTWDDHDYGANDAGVDYMFKDYAKQLYLTAWDVPAHDERRKRDGVYTSKIIGPAGQRVQIILLDTRSFRTGLTKTDEWGATGKERYLPSADTSGTMLGAEQWDWLESELKKPAELRLIATSIQMHADGHGWEAWRTLPHEQKKFYDLLKRTQADNTVLISGDRHAGALYKREGIFELTSSSLNLPASKWRAESGETSVEAGPYRTSDMVYDVNYGLIDIDWTSRQAKLTLRVPGQDDVIQNVPF